jgi:hypothetical protein
MGLSGFTQRRKMRRKSISRKDAKAQGIISSKFHAKYAKGSRRKGSFRQVSRKVRQGFYSGNPFRAKTQRII